jgi:exopolysaccharide biosynthesis polyprenyl glycosylphosphotransferase
MKDDVLYRTMTSVCAEESDQIELYSILADSPVAEKRRHSFYDGIKRIFDVILSAFAIGVLLPLLFIVFIAIRLDSTGPAIYTQKRAGKDGRSFTIYKFRSMCEDAEKQRKNLQEQNECDGPIFKILRDPRVTGVGKFLRKTSLDELPQLFNIIKGDMSIVGPRPPLLDEVEQYTPRQMHRLDVKPGLTCYWQIDGRSNIGFEQWVQLDLQYIEERGIWTDVKIILKTVPAVFLGRGAY